ncbi:MAG: recombinase family protein [Hydrogenoanaerobacterium sp.]
MAERTIIIIPPKYMDEPLQLKHLRVAAYCRVSTATEEQSSSLESQILYYTAKIAENPLWTNAGVYGEAVTGRNTKERSEFKKLMVKCRKHKVDLILTKSISRFGRNALDEIRSIRELQRLCIDIFFEQENIHSLDPDARIAIETHCAIAQRESESKSHDIKWGVNRGFQNGTSGYLSFKCYGYRSDKKHGLVVEPHEAAIVQMIFNLRLEGHSLGSIASELAKRKILSPNGKPIWSRECIRKMLINEKYTGSVMLQKTFIEDYFSGKQKKNTGQQERYLVENSHPAIISKEIFDKVQEI